MTFPTEFDGYRKTALSDLQGAWLNFRSTLVDLDGMKNRNRLLFHVEEAMSWECVRDLERMRTLTTLIRNIVLQSEPPSDVVVGIEEVAETLQEVFAEIAEGEKL
jgi:hypothetical protein